jgi:hypothetical protein
MNSELKAGILGYVKTHPQMSFAKFSEQSGIKISDCYYYMIRREVFACGSRVNSSFKSGGIYINLIAIPSTGLSEETKRVVLDVVRAINTSKGTRLEVVENVGEKTLEIRQVGLK